MIKLIIFFVIVLLNNVYAQKLTIGAAVNRAKNSNLTIQSQKKTEEIIRYETSASKRLYLPSLSLVGGYTHLSNPLEIDLSQVQGSVIEGMANQNVSTLDHVYTNVVGTPLTQIEKESIYLNTKTTLENNYPDWSVEIAPQDYFTANLILKQPIFLAGALFNTGSIGESNYRKAKIVTEKVNDDVTQKVINSYLENVLLLEVKNSRRINLGAVEKHAENTEKLSKQGIIPAYQLYGAQAAVSKAKALFKVANNNYENGLLTLKVLLDFPMDTIIELTTPWKEISISPDKQSIHDNVHNYSPILRLNNQNLHLAKSTLNSRKAEFLPTIFAIGEFQLYQRNLPVTTPPWMIGAQMKWDIFNGTRTFIRMKASQLSIQEVELNNRMVSNELNLLTSKLYNDATNAFEMYQAQKSTVILMEKSLDAITKEFSHGLVRSIVVIDAQTTLDESRVAASTYLYAYYLALIELYKMEGRLDEFILNFEK